MFEGVVAALLNRFLGKYVQDLDTEHLNVGIFGGDVQLHNLRLRPEALYELDLPIEVKAGTIGRVSLNIPWSGLYTESVVVTVEDVYVVAGPVIQGPYDAERDKRLLRAAKKRVLSDWLGDAMGDSLGAGVPNTASFLESLVTTVMNNLQIFIRNVHIRYEDTVMHPDPAMTFTCGICLFNLSVEFTNNKWKPCPSSPGASSVYQLIRIESLSAYVNPEGKAIVGDRDPDQLSMSWLEDMARGLKQFNTGADPLKFVLQPVSAKVKVIVNRSSEARVPKLLVDFVVEDVSLRMTREQFVSLRRLQESLGRYRVAWRFRALRPVVGRGRACGSGGSGWARAWWHFAYEAVLEQRVRPYTWARVRAHRDVYARYRDALARALLRPNDTELRLDLQRLEDQLGVVDILVAREHAKLQLHREDPQRVAVAARTPSWWGRWFASGASTSLEQDSRSPSPELQVRAERARGLWAQLTASERERLFEAIGHAEGAQRPEKPKQYIEHKLNVTLVNCSASLLSDTGEVLAAHLSHALASLETRPSANAYKLSLRLESAVVEGASLEHHLVPLVTANVHSGNNYSNFLAIDIEKNPSKTDADFGLSITMEPMEIVYHEHAVSELLDFFCVKPRPWKDLISSAGSCASDACRVVRGLCRRALTRRSTYCLSVDLRGPYVVIPESGSMQKGGQVLVVDFGRVVARTELQPPGVSLEDATQMEMEERLYDRLHVECSEAQVLFCDSGDEWRESRRLQDSELHVVPKARGQLVFSNSVRPECRQLARHKLTVSLASLKLNLSDRRIGLALDFMENVPAPKARRSSRSGITEYGLGDDASGLLFPGDRVPAGLSAAQLARVRRVVALAAVRVVRGGDTHHSDVPKAAVPDMDRSFVSSDQSDSEEAELWARTVDLPGFDDNVSPHNAITMLLRFVIGEVVVNLARSSNRVDKPYLLLRLGKLCWDSAIMEYGPAVQVSLGSVQLVDRLHAVPGGGGRYLEMISTDGSAEDDVLSLLYRKVRSNCPDFKSHFHAVEKSLVVDVATVSLVLHQEAFVTLNKYLQYIADKVQSRDSLTSRVSEGMRPSLSAARSAACSLWRSVDDPPIPQGATKLSWSARLSELRLRLCDADLDQLDVRVSGLEGDCMFKANERMVLRTHLMSLHVEDLTDATLYQRVIQLDDERVLDFKYVRHAPRLYSGLGGGLAGGLAGAAEDDVKSDGSLKVKLGRMRVVLLYKTLIDLQHFVEPLGQVPVPRWLAGALPPLRSARALDRAAGRLRTWPTRLHVSLDLHLPALLLPQKTASPNLVVANLGDLTVENFFKEVPSATPDGSVCGGAVIDNILVRLDGVNLSRGVMTLAGALHVLEPILEPVALRLDVKRLVASAGSSTGSLLLYEVNGGVDLISLSLSQRDLATLLAVWTDNLAEGRFFDFSDSQVSPLEPTSPGHGHGHGHGHGQDDQVRQLQQFFAQSEQGRREASVRLTLDGLNLRLFNDVDEMLSSPVRDINGSLCHLELGEASLTLDAYADRSLDLRASLLTCVLEDIRLDYKTELCRVFHSHAGETRPQGPQGDWDSCAGISVSQPPIVELTFRRSAAGDRSLDILVEQTRLNLTVSFLAAVAHFVLDALPSDADSNAQGVVNQGYVGDLNVHQHKPQAARPPSSEDSTSGCFSSRASCAGGSGGDQPGLAVSLQLRKPEVLLASDARGRRGHGLLLRTEVTLDYNRHSYRETVLCSLASLRVLSLPAGAVTAAATAAGGADGDGADREPCHQVLFPCDIEFNKTFKTAEEGVKVVASVSPVHVHLCASTVRTILEIAADVNTALQYQPEEASPLTLSAPDVPKTPDGPNSTPAATAAVAIETEDMWIAKKAQPYGFSEPCEGLGCGYAMPPQEYISETMTVTVPEVRVVLELEADKKCVPLVLVRAAAEAHVRDWTTQLHMRAELQLQASFMNGALGSWEPLIEPVVEAENVFRPWELQVRLFRAKAFPISGRVESVADGDGGGGGGGRVGGGGRRASRKRSTASHSTQGQGHGTLQPEDSQTSGEDTEPEHGMAFIRRPRSDGGQEGQLKESASVASHVDDSDSEDEDGVMEKLAGAIGYLFSGDSSDGEASESDESSAAEPSAATEEASEMETASADASTVIGTQERAIFLTKHSDSVDSGLEAEPMERQANYLLLQAKDRLELTVSPEALRALSRLRASFSLDPVNNNLRASYPPLSLNNSLGPGSSAVITTKAEKGLDGADRVLARSRSPEEETDSAPGSPHASPTHRKHLDSDVHLYSADVRDGGDDVLYCNASHHGDELFSPVMKFPQDSISELYRKVTDLRLTANVEGFEPIQVLCPRRSCHKLHALLPAKNGVRYHIMLDVETGCQYSRVTVRSPLQVRNETAFSIGLYYKKSVFDGLGLAHIGEATNPFDDAILFATLEPDKVCDVPLHVAYNCKLHFHPAYHPFRVSEAGLWWKDLAADLNIAKDFHCPAKDDKDPKVFSCRVMCSEGVPVKQTHRSIPNYMLRLLPPLQFYNALPFAVELRAPVVHWEQRVEAGERASQYFLDLQRGNRVTVDVPAYLGLSWSGAFNLGPELEEKTIVMATEKDTEGGNKTLAVTVRVDRTGTGSCVVYLHAPFWVVNKTGLPLQLRGSLSDVVYDVTGEEALLFSFRKVRRRCVRLRAYHSSWSSAFALDNVDTNGLVVCRDRERRRHYRILLSVRLSSGCPHLTKIVTLLPNLVVSNRSGRPLRFMEENEKADLWLDLAAGQSAPFWPVTDSMRMMVKYRDSALASQHFPVTHTHSTVLRMDRGTALVVDVSGGGDAPFHVAFRSYREGDAPLRVDNLCEDLFLKVHQQGLGQAALLSPYQSMLYTWDDPVRERCLLWNVYNKKSKGFVADFWKDGYGQERVCFHSVRQPPGAASSAPASTVTAKLSAGLKLLSPKAPRQDGGSSSSDDTESDDLLRSQQQLRRTRRDKVVVFWVSFLEGQQRVLLFTQDERVAAGARRRIQSERAGLEAFVSLAGVGLSLAAHAGAVGAAGPAGSRHRHAELAYLSLTDSAAVWEVCVGHRWKALGLELASWLEDKWRHDMKRAQMKEYVHVDFEKMHMTKPFYGELRRRYNPALWVQVRRSGHLTYARTSIHRMQLDNQLPSAHFPTVLCPAAAASASAAAAPAEPGLAAARGALRPCLDVIVLKRARPAHSQDVYKYVKVLMQEWCVQLERDFLDTIFDAYPQWGMWSARSGTRGAAGPGPGAAADDEPHRLLEGLRQDVALSYLPVQFAGAKTKEDSKEALFEHVHVSPILVRLSMFPRRSARPGGGKGFPLRRMAVVDHVFNALVPPLAEVKNVRLKMAYFERQGLRAAWRSVAADVRRHYYSQLMQQVHALVLGLDVLANPYGLVSDLGDLSFFYEPCAAIIEGPDEFAEDLSRAAQALLGNLTGAEAGGLSLLAPSLGAVFAFEDEYKKRRRHCLQQATDLPESARAASRTFSMGVLMGLSGVVLRPSVGVPQEGAEGFFRGTGKGLLGLMTKPGGNVVDCVAMAHDGIKRATEVGEDMMMRTRLPRHLDPLQGVRPFSPYEATGHALLGALCRGLYADMYSDTYWAHAGIDAKATLLITLQHVFLLEQCRQWGPSEVEWFVRVDDILEVPKLEGSKLIFKVRQDDNFTAFSGDERSVSSEDLSVLMWLRDKLEAVLVLNMEDKPVPTLA